MFLAWVSSVAPPASGFFRGERSCPLGPAAGFPAEDPSPKGWNAPKRRIQVLSALRVRFDCFGALQMGCF